MDRSGLSPAGAKREFGFSPFRLFLFVFLLFFSGAPQEAYICIYMYIYIYI